MRSEPVSRSLSLPQLADRPLLLPVLLLSAGAASGGPTFDWPLPFLLCAVAALTFAVWKSERLGSHLALSLAAFAVGLGVSTLHARPKVPPPQEPLEGEVVAAGDGWVELPGGRLFSLAPMPRLIAGQRVRIAARLSAPSEGALNPGEWSSAEKLRRRGIAFVGAFDPKRMLVLSEPPAWRRSLEDLRLRLRTAVRAKAPSEEAATLFLTLAAGDRALLSEQVEDRFARSGLAHILSVSGLHVAALALMLLWVARRLVLRLRWAPLRRFDARQWAAPFAVPLLWLYVTFTGSQPPAVRSAWMCTLWLLALTLLRKSDALNSLAFAVGAVVLVDPAELFDLSFQLSVLAALSLVLLSPVLRNLVPLGPPHPVDRWPRLMRAREAVLQTLLASVAVTVSSAPLIAATFHRVSLAGLLSNVVVLPLAGALTGLAAGGAALFSISPVIATPVLWAGAWASELLLRLAALFAELPGASLSLSGPALPAVVCWVLGLLGFALVHRAAGLLVPVGAALWLALSPVPNPSTLEVTFLSVGHGDAIVLSSRGHHALIDGGGNPQGGDPGRRVVVPFLQEKQIHALDLAVLSHAHPDHALGLATAIARTPTARLWLPAGVEDGPLVRAVRGATRAPVDFVEAGHPVFQLGDATLEVLGPPTDRVLLEGENDRSVVIRVRHGDNTFLLTGDLEEAGEESLEPGPVTVMKAPHHGSRTSSTRSLLDRARPKHAVFSVGRRNRFHFPHREVVERYQALGARTHRTDLDGAVTFISDGQTLRVSSFLKAALDDGE